MSAGRCVCLDDVRHREGFAGARDAEQHLIVLVLADAFDQLRDGLRLVAFRLVFRDDLEPDAAFAFLGPLRPVRNEDRHAARDDRVGRHQRLAGEQFLGALGALLRLG